MSLLPTRDDCCPQWCLVSLSLDNDAQGWDLGKGSPGAHPQQRQNALKTLLTWDARCDDSKGSQAWAEGEAGSSVRSTGSGLG